MPEKMITDVPGMPGELSPNKIQISVRYSHPRLTISAGSVLIGRNTACRLDKVKILCMPSKHTLSRLG
jgi:hypothetical protein